MFDETFTPGSPVVIPEIIIVHDGGELPRGLYYYVITTEGYIPSHVLQVYAGNKENSITLEWKSPKGGTEYKIYRGTTSGRFDGFFTVYSAENICYFFDNGMGELQEI
jgi:hypothetical protein